MTVKSGFSFKRSRPLRGSPFPHEAAWSLAVDDAVLGPPEALPGGSQIPPLFVHPAPEPRGVAVDECVVGHVARDDAAAARHGVGSDRDPGEDARARAEGGALPNERLHRRLVVLAPRPQIVGEDDSGTEERVVLHPDAVPEVDPALHGHTVSQDHVALDEAVVADVAVLADDRAGKDVRERPDAGPPSDRRRLDDRGGVYERVHSQAL